jgi:para-aminobenzoate synthetase/4-amino-4-deoxychorismate lyase
VYSDVLRQCPGARDALLFNAAGEITETTIANIAFEIDGALFTPPVACGLLPGVLRASLLAQGRLRERVVTIADARRAAAFYLMNAVRGLRRAQVALE